ncbi:MAG: hypothetical protein ACE5FA_01770 [Dehalococcoidia bacterium]
MNLVALVTLDPAKNIARWLEAANGHPAGLSWSLLVIDRGHERCEELGRMVDGLDLEQRMVGYDPDARVPHDRTLVIGGYRAAWAVLEEIQWRPETIVFWRDDVLPAAAGWLGAITDACAGGVVVSPWTETRSIDPAVIGARRSTWETVARLANDTNPIPTNLRRGGPVVGEETAARDLTLRVTRAALAVRSREEYRQRLDATGAYRAALDRTVYETVDS